MTDGASDLDVCLSADDIAVATTRIVRQILDVPGTPICAELPRINEGEAWASAYVAGLQFYDYAQFDTALQRSVLPAVGDRLQLVRRPDNLHGRRRIRNARKVSLLAADTDGPDDVVPSEMPQASSDILPAPPDGPMVPAEHAQVALARAVQYAEAADARNTLRAYRSDWQSFIAWCRDAGLAPLPAEPATVGAYLAAHAQTHAVATLRRRLVTIARAHKQAGIAGFWPGHPAIRNVLRGIARERGTAQSQASALTTPEIRRLVAVCGDDLAGLRDRALILLGYAAALRRSELVGIDREHLVLDARGLRLTLPRSKGDQEGRGEDIGVVRGKRRETCPIRAAEEWLRASKTEYGPVFRWVTRWGTVEPGRLSAGGVLLILRRRAKMAELDGVETITPHSLRAGFVTEAYRAGLRDEAIMQHTRHRDLASMRRYVRRARLLEDSAAAALDL